MERSRSLLLLLGRSNCDKLPPDIAKKLEKVLEENADLKNRVNGSQKTIEKLQRDQHISSTDKKNLEKSHSSSEMSVTELRQQLNTVNVEMNLLSERIKTEEKQNVDLRKQRDDLEDENDQLKDICGRKDTAISQLQSELTSVKQQLEAAVSENERAENCIADMKQQEQLMIDNGATLEKQIERLNNEIVKWTDKYNEQAAELTLARQTITSATTHMEIELKQKMEELSAANFTIRQLTESTQLTTSQRDGVTAQLKNQLNESVALIEHYKRELDAKIKLVDLYRANLDDCHTESTSETTSLKQYLKQTTEKCEMLESNFKNVREQHQLEVREMSATIEKLKDELHAAKAERVEEVLEELFPRAATSNRMLKDNASLTEIFSRYHDSLDEVHRLEIECLHMNTTLECSTLRLQNTTAEFERQQIEYWNILKQNKEMAEQVDAVVAEQDNLRERLTENSQRLANAESENVQLKCTQKDLARQICNLLNKMETNGSQPTSDQLQLKRMGLSNQTIRKELITFDNIVELQENNQKLMLKIRELSSKVEKLEEQNVKLQSCEQKISYLERQVTDGEAARLDNEDLLAMTMKQKERFKQLYFDAMNYMGKPTFTEEEVVENGPLDSSRPHHVTTDWKELKLQEKLKELKALKEEHHDYQHQATVNFNMLKEQCESVELKVAELLSENSKLRSLAHFTSERMTSKESDVAMYRKRVHILEERNQIYDKAIAKQETANSQLRQEYWNTIMQLSTAENRCDFLEKECRRLIDANRNLDVENNALHRQKMTQSILESSCELARISSERCDLEGRIRIEKQLEDQVRQCDVLKRQLEDEQNRFTEENESLKRQRNNASNKLSDEKAKTENLQAKLSELREQDETKTKQIQNLSEKLQEAIAYGNSATCLAKKSRSSKDLGVELNKKTAEIEKLNLELEELTTKTKLFDRLKSNWEAEKSGLKSDLEACKLSETNSKAHIDELQCEIRRLSSINQSVTVVNLQAENRKASEKIIENHKELQELRRQCLQLKENLQIVERNYADVLSARSLDLQGVTSLRTELSSCQEEMQQLKLAKVQADELKTEIQMKWEATSKKLTDDRQELQHKVDILEEQNSELVDLLQAQNTKSSSDDQSVGNTSIMNRTFTEEEFENFSTEKLFGVIKYLRREKDISVTQMDVLNIENVRLSAELDMQKNRVDELSDRMNSAESLTPSPALSVEYEELCRAAGKLNAVTDSNILLRAENRDLCHRVEDLAEKIARLEGETLRLQKENRELFGSCDGMTKENFTLRLNSDMLKTTIERLEIEILQLATEKENQQQVTEELSSMKAEVTAEKEKQRQATEELNLMKAEKSRLEQDVESKSRHLQTLENVRRKLMQKISKQEEEIKEAKTQLKASAVSVLKAKNEAKSFENQSLALRALREKVSSNEHNPESLKKDHVTSTESGSPATASLKKPIGLKRSRDSDAVQPIDANVSTAVDKEKVSPQSKRSRLQRGCENVPSKSQVDEGIDPDNNEAVFEDEVALSPGAQQVIVDGKQTDETGVNESPGKVGDDMTSEVESVDSGRVSSELRVAPNDFQLDRTRKTSSRTEAVAVRRGRSRLNK